MSNKIGFGSTVPKFMSDGKHPKLLRQSGFLSTSTNRNIGPGTYNTDSNHSTKAGKFSHSWNKYSDQQWKRQYVLEQNKTIPYFMIKDRVAKEKYQESLMGPGFYDIDKPLDYLTKPFAASEKGCMNSRSNRFKVDKRECHPGPGTYGIPYDTIDRANETRRHANSVGALSRGGDSNRLGDPPSYHLGPGVYDIIENRHKSTGSRGFYDCNSIDRSKPINIGHHAERITYNLGPGQYSPEKGEAETVQRYTRFKGHFYRSSRSPDFIKQEQMEPIPVSVNQPQQSTRKSMSHHSASSRKVVVPFGSSNSRMNKAAVMNFLGSDISLAGPGRYNTDISEIGNTDNRPTWNFKSTVPQISNSSLEHIFKHRVKPVNIPESEKPKISHVPKNDGDLRIHLGDCKPGLLSNLVMA